MLSLVGGVLQAPIETIVKARLRRPNAKASMLGEINSASPPLRLARSFEIGASGACSCGAQHIVMSVETLAALFVKSVQWTNEVFASTR